MVTVEDGRAFLQRGFLELPSVFTSEQIERITAALPDLYADQTPRRVMEKDGVTVRSVYGPHQHHPLFARLVRHRPLVEIARAILDSEVYVYQYKINAKAAFGGDVWTWHQDLIYWLREDGMPNDRVVNFLIPLDPMTEFNGPIFFIPGSHKHGVIDVPPHQPATGVGRERRAPYRDSPAWLTNLIADIKYQLDRPTVARLVEEHGMVAPKTPVGGALLFHSNLVHASPGNLSPYDRRVMIITYNSVHNVPVPAGERRPEFLAGRDTAAVEPLGPDEALFEGI